MRVFRRCLSTNVADRYGDASSLSAALADVISSTAGPTALEQQRHSDVLVEGKKVSKYSMAEDCFDPFTVWQRSVEIIKV